MIKALAKTRDGRQMVILGLDKRNVHRLTEGLPIHVKDLAEHGGPDFDVVIVYGDSYEDILEDFRGIGLPDQPG